VRVWRQQCGRLTCSNRARIQGSSTTPLLGLDWNLAVTVDRKELASLGRNRRTVLLMTYEKKGEGQLPILKTSLRGVQITLPKPLARPVCPAPGRPPHILHPPQRHAQRHSGLAGKPFLHLSSSRAAASSVAGTAATLLHSLQERLHAHLFIANCKTLF
jgi:hypothetical protein